MINSPSYLNPTGKALWQRFSLVLSENLNEATAETLGILCQAYSDWRDANETLRKEGQYIGGKHHPAKKDRKEAYEVYTRLSCELHLTPKSKRRPSVDALDDELSNLMG